MSKLECTSSSHPNGAPRPGSPVTGAAKGSVLYLGLCAASFRTLLLRDAFVPPQDSIYDEMEDKWSKKKAEWEKNEQLEREKILLHQSEYRNF